MDSKISLKNLYNPKISKKKGVENECNILNFLLKEKYSTAAILQKIVDVKSRSAICRILKRMEKKGLLRKHRVNLLRVIYGITNSGLHEAQSDQEKIQDWHYFEPSKVNPLTLDHQLDIQQIHAFCTENKLNFVTGRELGSRADADKVADGIIEIGDKKIAIEVELHVKSKRRYDSVIYNYLKLIKSGEYYSVLYVSDTLEKVQKIKRAIHSLDKITMKIDGKNKDLKITEAHLSYFEFLALDEVNGHIQTLKKSIIDA